MLDDDDLFGSTKTPEPAPPVKRGPGRPRKDGTWGPRPGDQPKVTRTPPSLEMDGVPSRTNTLKQIYASQLRDPATGVTIPTIARIFRKSARTVNQAIRDNEIKPIGDLVTGGLVYDLADVAAVLVDQTSAFQHWLKNIKSVDELPEHLRDGYWSAMLKRQRYEAQAGELWPTGAIEQLLGDTALKTKTSVQLWEPQIDLKLGLTKEQRVMIRELAWSLVATIDKMVNDPAVKNATRLEILNGVTMQELGQ